MKRSMSCFVCKGSQMLEEETKGVVVNKARAGKHIKIVVLKEQRKNGPSRREMFIGSMKHDFYSMDIVLVGEGHDTGER